VADPADLAASLDRYQADLLVVIDAAGADQAAIDEAFDAGLAGLAVLERDAAALDAVGTAQAADALRELSSTTALASAVLVGILVAAVVAGVALMVVAARVLRELRRASAAERLAAAGLADLLRARSDFIADASHELRTPLTVLRGNAELGLRLAPADDEHVPILREIAGEATRMGRLVEELLLLARHDAGDAMSQPRRVELEALTADSVARSEVLCRGRGIRLESDATAIGEAVLDADRIEQAILILVDNASTHSRPGDAVSLRIAAEADELLIEVGDRGPGIPADVRPFIFERFHRAERSRRGQEGAGLGLAIARAIAEEHRGTITPGDRPDGGTLMAIRIPWVRPDAAPGDGTRHPGRSR
jgi:two-component system OmpR family sensor kinase